MKESPGNSVDREPEVDPSQDYQLLLGYENSTHTVLRFRRRLDTCDHHDIPITVGCEILIFCVFELRYVIAWSLLTIRVVQGKGGVEHCCFLVLRATRSNDPTLFTTQCIITLFRKLRKMLGNSYLKQISFFFNLTCFEFHVEPA